MSNGGDSAVSPEEALFAAYYAQAKQMAESAAAETALLDAHYANGPDAVKQYLSELHAKARAEADEITKRLKGESGGDSTNESGSDSGSGGTADVGPSPVG